MGGQSDDSSSAAPLGFLAPLCVAVFFVFIWAAIGTRHIFCRPPQQAGVAFDLENGPLYVRSPPIARNDVDKLFPLIQYSVWWEERDRQLATTLTSQSSALSSPTEDEKGKERTVAPGGDGQSSPSDNKSDDISHNLVQNGNDGPTKVPLDTGETHSLCAICMEGFSTADLIRPLTCGHIFHSGCVDPWLTRRQACCPLCKMSFSRHRTHTEAGTHVSPFMVPVLPAIALVRTSILPHRV
ncbi:putative RING finger protein [Aspergillus melleus]|uniref:putative RING finger protein n=1 Tax=Aspergillus melleus TaxID=138277 RepID=UPI001E8D94FE|nr:uncharacterized protein LDX57_006211 [Aspergillus melleus]KAH8428512.1 hypothetical protein LDX57_006211 [Aspergillus melleus]